jgi:hypothetical protein
MASFYWVLNIIYYQCCVFKIFNTDPDPIFHWVSDPDGQNYEMNPFWMVVVMNIRSLKIYFFFLIYTVLAAQEVVLLFKSNEC